MGRLYQLSKDLNGFGLQSKLAIIFAKQLRPTYATNGYNTIPKACPEWDSKPHPSFPGQEKRSLTKLNYLEVWKNLTLLAFKPYLPALLPGAVVNTLSSRL